MNDMIMAAPGVHRREHRSVLAAAEKRLLVWIAVRLPREISSDHLSALGLASMAAAGGLCAMLPVTHWAAYGVVLALAVNWFGDSLDGTVARVRRQQRPRYGYYVDHFIDLAGTSILLAGLACSNLMHPIVALMVLCGYLLVSSETYLAAHAAGVFRISFLGLGPTELRILLAIGVLKAAQAPFVSNSVTGQVRLFDVGGVTAAVGLLAAFLVSGVGNVRALYLAEPLPAAGDESRTP
jgi:phosphatidylglycerophosphate synthase